MPVQKDLNEIRRIEVDSSKTLQNSENSGQYKAQDRGLRPKPCSTHLSSEMSKVATKERTDNDRRSRSRSRDRSSHRRENRSVSKERRIKDRSRSRSREKVHRTRRGRSKERMRDPAGYQGRKKSNSPEPRSERKGTYNKSRSRSPRKRPRSNSPGRRSPRRHTRSKSNSPRRKLAKTSVGSMSTRSAGVVGKGQSSKMKPSEENQLMSLAMSRTNKELISKLERMNEQLEKKKKEIGDLDEKIARFRAYKALQQRTNLQLQDFQQQKALISQHILLEQRENKSPDHTNFRDGSPQSMPLESTLKRSSELGESGFAFAPDFPSSGQTVDVHILKESSTPHQSCQVDPFSSQQSIELEKKTNANIQMNRFLSVLNKIENINDIFSPVAEQTKKESSSIAQRSGHVPPSCKTLRGSPYLDGLSPGISMEKQLLEITSIDEEDHFLYGDAGIEEKSQELYDKGPAPYKNPCPAKGLEEDSQLSHLKMLPLENSEVLDLSTGKYLALDSKDHAVSHHYGAKSAVCKQKHSQNNPTNLSDADCSNSVLSERPSRRQVFLNYDDESQISTTNRSLEVNQNSEINVTGLTMTIQNVPDSDEEPFQDSPENLATSPDIQCDQFHSFAHQIQAAPSTSAVAYSHHEEAPFAGAQYSGSTTTPPPMFVSHSEIPPSSQTVFEPYTIVGNETYLHPTAIQHSGTHGAQSYPPPTVQSLPSIAPRMTYLPPVLPSPGIPLQVPFLSCNSSFIPHQPQNVSVKSDPSDCTTYQSVLTTPLMNGPEPWYLPRPVMMPADISGATHLPQSMPSSYSVPLHFPPDPTCNTGVAHQTLQISSLSKAQRMQNSGQQIIVKERCLKVIETKPLKVPQFSAISEQKKELDSKDVPMVQTISKIDTKQQDSSQSRASLQVPKPSQTSKQNTEFKNKERPVAQTNLKMDTQQLNISQSGASPKVPQFSATSNPKRELKSKEVAMAQTKSKLALYKQRWSEKNKIIMEARLASVKEEPTTGIVTSKEVKNVWVCGHALVHLAEKRAISQVGNQLDLDPSSMRLWWTGLVGMTWDQLVPQLYQLKLNWPNPDMLIIHLGGNDINRRSQEELLSLIRQELISVCNLLPQCRIVWSDILPRRFWKHGGELIEDVDKSMDRTRVLINSKAHALLSEFGGRVMIHDNIGTEFYRPDGIHLSGRGIDAFNSNIRTLLNEWEQEFFSETCKA